MIHLPRELVERIVKELSLEDLKNLSLCSRRYHDVLQAYVFKSIKCSWEQIDEVVTLLLSKRKYVYRLIVYNKSKDSFGEWNINLLEKFDLFNKLDHIEVNLLNSTNCLKYQRKFPNHVRQITLTTSSKKSIFSLYHIKNYENLEKLSLTNFKIIRDLEEPVELRLNLRELKIFNCHWDWPFELNFYSNLITLELVYDITNPFILGERFKDFLSENTRLENLRYLKIEISDSHDRNLYFYPSLNLVNLKNLNNLEKLSLINFKNLDFKKFLSLVNQLVKLEHLNLKLINNNDLKDIDSYKHLLLSKVKKVDLVVHEL